MNPQKFAYRLLARQTEPIVVAMAQPSQAAVIKIDTRIQSIKTVAALRMTYRPVSDDAYVGVSGRTKGWLQTLDTKMLLLVISASHSQLPDHIAGRRCIRGGLAADADSVAAYREALKPRIAMLNADEGQRSGGGPKRSVVGMKL